MKSIAIQTGGSASNQDYQWQDSGDSQPQGYQDLRKFIDDSKPSIIVAHRAGCWHFVLGGIRSASHDFRGRNNRVTVVFSGLTQDESRALAVHALSDWEGTALQMEKGIRWVKDAGHRFGWEADFALLKSISHELIGKQNVKPDAPAFSDRREDDAQDPDNWKNLAREVSEHSFSKSEGLKLVVTGSPTEESYHQIVEESERVLCSGRSRRILPQEKKSPQRPPGAENPSGRPSWMQLLGICAIIVLIVGGVLWAVRHKKKAQITKIELLEGASSGASLNSVYLVHFNQSMATNAVPEIVLTQKSPPRILETQWSNPTTLKVTLERTGTVEVQIQNATTAEGGRLLRYEGELPRTPQRTQP